MEMDVSHFHPNDLKISVRHGEILVEGHQKLRHDQHGYVARHFTRRFILPDVDDTTVTSNLKDNEILEVIARKKNALLEVSTRNIPIQLHRTDQTTTTTITATTTLKTFQNHTDSNKSHIGTPDR